jgi:protein-S-isoprenylcysteine O-methyltransferase Ste14
MPFDFGVKILAVALSVAWGVSEQAFARRNRRAVGPTSHEGDKGSFHWISASVVVGMSMAGAFGFSGVGGVTNVHVWELLGAVVLVVGTAIRLHAIAALAKHFTSRVTILAEHKLVRGGLYRYVRHPSYLGQILILVGIGALMANVVALLTAPLMTTVALLWRIRVEERAMAEHFGAAYEEYRKTTWRLLPLVW